MMECTVEVIGREVIPEYKEALKQLGKFLRLTKIVVKYLGITCII